MAWIQVELGWLAKNTGRVAGQPIFYSGKKMGLGRVGLENSNSFCHV